MNPDTLTHILQPYAPHHRPLLHFAPHRNWINDPNGLVFLNGQYHLFFQHNPYGTDWGHMSWGHAVSKDLLHWEERPVALAEDDTTMIFSGCCVLDANNTSGFGTVDGPALIALYTGHHHDSGLQTQNLAYSLDEGQSWTRYGVVLDEGIPDFRDPKVFWHEKTRCWIMAVVLAAHHQVVFYASQNLKSWEKRSVFGPEGHTGGIWEVPELLELQDDAGESHWVLKVDLNPGGPFGGSGCQYFVGQFDGWSFTSTQEARWLDHGKDFYAAITFANLQDRTVWLGWMNNWEYARNHVQGEYSGVMSLPREIRLQRTADGLILCQTPIREWEEVWRALPCQQELLVKADQEHDLLVLPEAALDLQAHFVGTEQSILGIAFSVAGQLEWTLEFDVPDRKVTVSRQGSIEQSGFQGEHSAPLESVEQHVRLIVDHSTLEVFLNDGKQVFTEVFFPPQGESRLSLYTRSGQVKVQVFAVRGPQHP
ncbi:glycoside hydrolase family 32 protein [Deinococcus cellulosilyticus]|uniref:Uncharacterized protein n=1 Tax=Deinococcus cellulosilyticus (strain DSM 18568 / NBRC 106333 / KACC 11606 / 5516J-15) TaxID=1223518 RepID=A0A511MY71_DEIC1|nr:glycoside hydrolase family 32 protein [Deinococcus cellulosilyticus]GEM45545.1 hypothetical protein DC3_11800 [Deinococcus cellulosilyticus NBRC 106333 = KACC 11606]